MRLRRSRPFGRKLCKYDIMLSELPIFTARKRSLRRLCFYRCLSVHTGGMRGFIWGACVVLFGGYAWFYLGGVCGFIRGACVVLFGGGVHGFFGYNQIRSMSGRYASYWNAFLLSRKFPPHSLSGNN